MIHDYLLCNFDCSVIGEIGACNGERIAFYPGNREKNNDSEQSETALTSKENVVKYIHTSQEEHKKHKEKNHEKDSRNRSRTVHGIFHWRSLRICRR